MGVSSKHCPQQPPRVEAEASILLTPFRDLSSFAFRSQTNADFTAIKKQSASFVQDVWVSVGAPFVSVTLAA